MPTKPRGGANAEGAGPMRRGRPPGPRSVTAREVAPVYDHIDGVLSRLNALLETLGGGRVASILGVSASQPSRWRSRKERPTREHQTRILELDYVCALLFHDMPLREGIIWLESYNYSLGTRPIDALTFGDFAAVREALEVEAQGGFV